MIEMFFAMGLVLLIGGIVLTIAGLLLEGYKRIFLLGFAVILLLACLPHFSVVLQEIGLTEVDSGTGEPTTRGLVMFNALSWGALHLAYALIMVNIVLLVHAFFYYVFS
ncbi:MAG: hypothetical protein QW324_07640 [Thermofilaceae archaeon]